MFDQENGNKQILRKKVTIKYTNTNYKKMTIWQQNVSKVYHKMHVFYIKLFIRKWASKTLTP